MYIYIYTYIYIHTHAYTHQHMYIYIHVYIFQHIFIRVCLGPAFFLPIREWRTEPAFSVAGCICASSWFPPLLSWSSLGAHPVAGYAWRPPGVGERAVGWVDGKGEGVGCFVRVYLFRNSSQACSRTYVYIYMYI